MGTRSASTKVQLQVTSTVKNVLTDTQPMSGTLGQAFINQTLETGVSANQANRCWEERSRSLSSGVTEDIDLYDLGAIDIGAGGGKDALGQDWVAEEIVMILFRVTSGTGRLEIMPTNPANPVTWLPSLTVANDGALKLNGVLLMYQPHTDAFGITDASAHLIRVGANGGDLTYDMLLLARHDDDESSSSSTSSSQSSSSSSSTSSTASSSTSSCSTSTLSSLSTTTTTSQP